MATDAKNAPLDGTRVLMVVALCAGMLALPLPAASQSAPAGNAEAGRQLFVRKGCYQCHGREGQGAPTTGPRLGPNPLALAAFVGAVRNPRAQMPPYTEKIVSDAELADMRAFLDSRPRPTSIDALVPR
jgi:ubiquinol-cytochrome c reductase cytochrome c subunit